MKNAFKSIKKMRFLSILIILQLAIGISMINTASVISSESKQREENISRLFDLSNTYFLRNIVFDPTGKEENIDWYDAYTKSKEVYKKLEELKEKGDIKENYIYYASEGGNPIVDVTKYLPEKYQKVINSELINITTEIDVNESFYNSYNLNIEKGRGFNKEDFKIDPKVDNIPIILGLDYSDYIDIGDTFDYEFPDLKGNMIPVKYEVVGFYKHNDMINIGGQIIGRNFDDIFYSDAFVIAPIISDVLYLSEGTIIANYGIWVEAANSSSMVKVEDSLKDFLDENNYTLRVKSLKDQYQNIKEVAAKSSINAAVLGKALIFLSIIGISAIFVKEIERRKKEFGIKISQGATINKICYEIICEILIMTFIALIISFILSMLKGQNMLSLEIMFKSTITMLVIVIISSICPLIKLKRQNIIDMLRGE